MLPSLPCRSNAVIATRDAGWQRLEAFLPAAGSAYENRRNFDLGPGRRHNVSCLSPWLRRRLILEEEVLAQVVALHGVAAAQKFIDEIFWRAYFRGWLAHRPDLWLNFSASVDEGYEALERDAGLRAQVSAAEAGSTGNEAFDFWARELRETGYLHNHARMWFASIWVYTLRLPWALGADFFLRHLLDGDPASNTLGWRWVCGLHTRGKHYLARRDNILKFTEGRLDPGPGLAGQAFTVTDEAPLAPAALELPEQPPDSQHPCAWLLTDDDVGLPRELPGPLPVLTMDSTGHLSPGRVSDRVTAFAAGALNDSLSRQCASHTELPRDTITLDARFRREAGQSPATGETLARRLSAWAKVHDVARIDYWHVPFGPAADALALATPALREAGVRLQAHVRNYDRNAWPLADRGFFRLRKHIPDLLAQLEAGQLLNA